MDVWVAATGFVDAVDGEGGEDADADVLGDDGVVGWVDFGDLELVEVWIWVLGGGGEGVFGGGVVSVGGGERGVGDGGGGVGWEGGNGAVDDGGGSCGGVGEVVGVDGKAEDGLVVLFREAEFGRVGVLGGSEGAVEGGQGYFKVDGVVGGGGLDGVC